MNCNDCFRPVELCVCGTFSRFRPERQETMLDTQRRCVHEAKLRFYRAKKDLEVQEAVWEAMLNARATSNS